MAETQQGNPLEELQKRLEEHEDLVAEQIGKISKLVEEETPTDMMLQEFRHAVELITKKYETLVSMLKTQKNDMEEEEYEDRSRLLREQYKEDITLLAVAIDEETGHTETFESDSQ
ncbi:MAG: hypothetical protein ABIG66_02595 [Candidatus Kerfeldbacteria bacterium]